jgi:uncharacterized protein (DUF1684 family)
MSELDDFRAEKDDFFGSDPQSPLTTEQKSHFAGLNYYPENPALRLEVTTTPLAEIERVEMQTSTGDRQTYYRHGRFHFRVEDLEAELTIYEGPHGFFLPFVDASAGTETYPSGRYLEPELLPGDRFLVDFNLAYNPYCAYNENWSCPLTPRENRLKVPILAGEKLFEVRH